MSPSLRGFRASINPSSVHSESRRRVRGLHLVRRRWSRGDDREQTIPQSCVSGRSAWSPRCGRITRRSGRRSGLWRRGWGSAVPRHCASGPAGPRSIGCVNLIWPDLLLRPTWAVVALAGRDCSTSIGHQPVQRTPACRARRRQVPVPAVRVARVPRCHCR
jgi:hypothetical protein